MNLEFFEDLKKSFGDMTKYSRMDQYKDFRAVFMSSPQGRRVLHKILSIGALFGNCVPIAKPGSPIDDKAVMMALGGRNVALQILALVTAEPRTEKPKQTTPKKGTKND